MLQGHRIGRALRSALLGVLATGLAAGGVAVLPAQRAAAAPTLTISAATAKTLYAYTYRQREILGKRPYVVRADLQLVALRQAYRMATYQRLYHNPSLTRDVANWRYLGENVGVGPSGVTLAHAFWNSAPHRANILNPYYTEVGIGAFWDGRVFWVAEVFRRPNTTTVSATLTGSSLSGSGASVVVRGLPPRRPTGSAARPSIGSAATA